MRSIDIKKLEMKSENIIKFQNSIDLLLSDCTELLQGEFEEEGFRFQMVSGEGLVVGDCFGNVYDIEDFLQCLRVGADIRQNCRSF